MKKITLLTDGSDTRSDLRALRELGLLHTREIRRASRSAERLRAMIDVLQRALKLPRVREEAIPPGIGPEAAPWRALRHARQCLRDAKRLEHLEPAIGTARRELARARAVGEYEHHMLAELGQAGLEIRFHVCSNREFSDFMSMPDTRAAAGRRIRPVGRLDDELIIAFMAEKGDAQLPFAPMEHPDARRAEARLAGLLGEHELITLRLSRNENHGMQRAHVHYENQLSMARAEDSLRGTRGLKRLGGYCPANRLEELRRRARQRGWGIVEQEPGVDEVVPTLLRYSLWTAPFRAVLKFMGVVPGYRDYDVNGIFLLFFSVFLAMIVGDAGYGLVLLAATFGFSRFFSIPRDARVLMYISGGAIMIWGALTGVWFGVREFAQVPPLSLFRIDALDGFSPTTTNNMIRFCLALGGLHLTVAHLRVMFSGREKVPRVFARPGWIGLLWGLYLIVGTMLLGDSRLREGLWLAGAGLLMVILFAEQKSPPEGAGTVLRGFARGLMRAPMTLLTGIGAFSDIISYIRLFAVGIATREVAVAFNNLATSMGFTHAGNAIAFIFIVLFGHSINILLAGMGVLVHGIRLNMLEFSRQIPLAWDGIEYRPFRLKEVPKNDAN